MRFPVVSEMLSHSSFLGLFKNIFFVLWRPNNPMELAHFWHM